MVSNNELLEIMRRLHTVLSFHVDKYLKSANRLGIEPLAVIIQQNIYPNYILMSCLISAGLAKQTDLLNGEEIYAFCNEHFKTEIVYCAVILEAMRKRSYAEIIEVLDDGIEQLKKDFNNPINN